MKADDGFRGVWRGCVVDGNRSAASANVGTAVRFASTVFRITDGALVWERQNSGTQI